ncbi:MULTISPECIES: hypothetical protein [unclassified Streptomyces]|uniref:hypothetical protein n=1 Tax=unclassified Streptomyces TaxID=2593676 RepID=UPI0036E92943
MKLLSKVFRQPKSSADEVMLRLLEESAEEAGHWAGRMPREAAGLVRRVRIYTLASAGLSLTAGLLVWPAIAESSQFGAQVVVSALSGFAALVIVAPHASGLSDRADEAIKLCSAYSAVYRDLLAAKSRLESGSTADFSHAADIFRRFQHIQERKDALGLPTGNGRVAGTVARIKGHGRPGRVITGVARRAELPPGTYALESGPVADRADRVIPAVPAHTSPSRYPDVPAPSDSDTPAHRADIPSPHGIRSRGAALVANLHRR